MSAIVSSSCCCTCPGCIRCASGFSCDSTVLPPGGTGDAAVNSYCWVPATDTARCRDLRFTISVAGEVAVARRLGNFTFDRFGSISYDCITGVLPLSSMGFGGPEGPICDLYPWWEPACSYAGHRWEGSMTVRIPHRLSGTSLGCPHGDDGCCWPGTARVASSLLTVESCTADPDSNDDMDVGNYDPCRGIVVFVRPWAGGLSGPATFEGCGPAFGFDDCSQCGDFDLCVPPVVASWISSPRTSNTGYGQKGAWAGCVLLIYRPAVAGGGVVGRWNLSEWSVLESSPGIRGYPILFPSGMCPYYSVPGAYGFDVASLLAATLLEAPDHIDVEEVP